MKLISRNIQSDESTFMLKAVVQLDWHEWGALKYQKDEATQERLYAIAGTFAERHNMMVNGDAYVNAPVWMKQDNKYTIVVMQSGGMDI